MTSQLGSWWPGAGLDSGLAAGPSVGAASGRGAQLSHEGTVPAPVEGCLPALTAAWGGCHVRAGHFTDGACVTYARLNRSTGHGWVLCT